MRLLLTSLVRQNESGYGEAVGGKFSAIHESGYGVTVFGKFNASKESASEEVRLNLLFCVCTYFQCRVTVCT